MLHPRLRILPATLALLGALAVPALCLGIPATGPAQPLPAPADLLMAAAKGDFAAVLRMAEEDKADAGFIADLKNWEAVSTRRTEARHQAFNAKTQELNKTLAAGELEESLVNLIEAKMLADDAKVFLAEKRTTNLVSKIEDMAAKAEAEHDWVEAGTLYRLLNTLFDKTRPYLKQAKKVALHEQALALYNPKKLVALYKEQAKRTHLADHNNAVKKKKAPILNDAGDEPEIETTPWQDRLKNITPRIVQEELFYAARRHIERPGYAKLLTGAIDSLDTTVSTEGLAETVPQLADAKKVAAFRRKLADLRQEVVADGNNMSLQAALSVIGKAQDASEQTVKLPDEMVLYELGMGITGRLDDFSNLIWPEQIPEFERMISGEFFGIGVQLSRDASELTVITPMDDTPAMRAGIRAGDVITHVNGHPTSTWTIDRAIKEITGEEGTPVTLKLRRAGADKPIEVTLTRAKIEVGSIRGWSRTGNLAKDKWNYWLDQPRGIAYIRMSQFVGQSVEDMDKAVKQAQSQAPIQALVLDLRYNPGGLLDAAADAADRFLAKGRIVSTVDADGHENQLFTARSGNEYGKFPVVVLVNEGSASASEILSGALQENHRVTVMGTNSYGKGSVQHILPVAHQSALFKLTMEHYALPTGRIIHREPDSKIWGVQPDIACPMTREESLDLAEAREEADYGKNADPESKRPPRTAKEILHDGLDPQVLTAKIYLETVLEASKMSRQAAATTTAIAPAAK